MNFLRQVIAAIKRFYGWILKVIMSETEESPDFLYKYMSVSGERREWLEDLITHSRFYFPCVIDFNDPFDCHPNFSVSDHEAFVRRLVNQELEGKPKREIEAKVREFLKSELWLKPDTIEQYRQRFLEELQYKQGVLSLSENSQSILMWSHYAEKHSGLCLTFDRHSEFFSRAKRVVYQSQYPVIDLSAATPDELVEFALFSKSEEWSYEQEWRIIEDQNGRVGRHVFPKENLIEVTFGARTDPETLTAIRGLIEVQMPHIRIYQMQVDATDFHLNRIELT